MLLYGTPVKIRFQSPTNGVSFHLRAGGSVLVDQRRELRRRLRGAGRGHTAGADTVSATAASPLLRRGRHTRTYQPICEAPCDATLLSGRHRFALSLNGARPIELAQPVDLTPMLIVEGRYVDKSRHPQSRLGCLRRRAPSRDGADVRVDRLPVRPESTGRSATRRCSTPSRSIITGSVLASQSG